MINDVVGRAGVRVTLRGWDINLGGVRSTIAKTIAAVEPLEKQAKAYADAMEAAGKASGSEVVNAALLGFGQHHLYTLPLLARRTSNCIRGVTLATNAYLAGDREMAERAHRTALTAPRPEDLLRKGRRK
ncbi:DUF6507 family protein [Actinomadura miaoliensis]|uniref:DUF6507 family protein n=1 Tax=Actinomadura miaoliensis TaxID=430685 RepID=UPI0031E4EDA6